MAIDVVGDVPLAAREALEVLTAGHRTLEEVVRWGLSQEPPRMIVEVIPQDEYTHDVVLPWGDGMYLVYDTT